jgi:hypothetical protein
VHAVRFITQRRFERFGAPEGPVGLAPAGFYTKAESAQLAAWDAHRRAMGRRSLPRDRNGGWWVETEWPPGHPKHSNGGQDEDCTRTPRAAADA